MSYVASDEYMRLGRKVDSDAISLNDAVDAAGIAGGSTARGGGPGWLNVDFWERWKGWYGGWTQFRSANIDKPPILPIQSTDDVDQWASEVDAWKKSFVAESIKAGKVGALAGPLGSATEGQEGGGILGTTGATYIKVAAFAGVALSLGYLLSGAARLRGR
jgi:hypothetical protein